MFCSHFGPLLNPFVPILATTNRKTHIASPNTDAPMLPLVTKGRDVALRRPLFNYLDIAARCPYLSRFSDRPEEKIFSP